MSGRLISMIALAYALSTITALDASAQIGSEYDSATLITLTCTSDKTEEFSIDPKNRKWDGDTDGDTLPGDGNTQIITVGISDALFTKEETLTMYLRSGHISKMSNVWSINRATGEYVYKMYDDGKLVKKYVKTGRCTVKSVEGPVGSPTQMAAATQQQAADEIAQQEREQKNIRSAKRAETFNQVAGILSDPNNNPNNNAIAQANAQQQANLQQTPSLLQQQKERQAQQLLAQQQAQQQVQQQEQQARVQQQLARQAPGSSAGSTAQSTADQSCTNMTSWVDGTVSVGGDGWVSGHFTNNSNQSVHVFYTFKENSIPSKAMNNAGATNIGPGQTVGGEGQGLYSTTADKTAARIYWYAVAKSDYDQGKPCAMSHSW